MKQGNIESFSNLSQFRDIEDFNNNFEQWMLDIKREFTKSELIALKYLKRYCAKVAGVSNAKIATITKTAYENNQPVSRSTVKRMVQKAKNLGLLNVYETERKNGSKSSNIYVFNRFVKAEEPSISVNAEPSKPEELNPPQTDNLSKTNNKNNNKRTEDVNYSETKRETLDASFVSERVPAEFVSLVKCFFDDAKQIEEYWKMVIISAYKNKITGEIIEIALQAFRTLIRKIKFSSVTNPYGFFYGVLNRKFKVISLNQSFNDWWKAI
ncbi:hypothetical protein DFO73_11627 [Cytobacillus oceanisediminis]|uniref:Uncharacterized protein n=1 Tax=Cytobacillus oceanisediminis TaxID=665099 RepID=A0A2V2ZJV7_9BACI|nr:hypothetical protein [Cytobacillus oceanisediminis]PWW20213.1 hypothetical protein DFO73_11627 [Cytobacillus oceanisediminis]